jgi:hypothetical protein
MEALFSLAHALTDIEAFFSFTHAQTDGSFLFFLIFKAFYSKRCDCPKIKGAPLPGAMIVQRCM